MKQEEYMEFHCGQCGWEVCAFLDSDLNQQYEKNRSKKRRLKCPNCKALGIWGLRLRCITNPKEYRQFYCRRCGWGICAFMHSDLNQQYEKSRKYLMCPYCKVRGTGTVTLTIFEPIILEIREPVVLREAIPRQLREEILEKDGRKCVICGSTENLQIDHIIPVYAGGATERGNLQVLCQPCNGSKSANGGISEKRKTIIHIRQSCAYLILSQKRVSMAEIARVSGVSYHFVLEYEDVIRRELKLPPNLKKYPYLASKQQEAGKG